MHQTLVKLAIFQCTMATLAATMYKRKYCEYIAANKAYKL